MYQFLAYVPYAAVGYCVAKVATDVWPGLRSQLGSVSHFSSRHGADGEAYGPRVGEEYCPPGGGASLGPSNLTADARRNASHAQAYVSGYEMDRFGNEVADDGCELDPRAGSPGAGYGSPRGGGSPEYGQDDQPLFSQATNCGPVTPWGRGADAGRLSRKRNRWG